jgi:hypothetical protein
MSDKTYTGPEVAELINKVLATNAADPAYAVRQRMAAQISGGYDCGDTLHNIYLDYGYPATLDFFNFWNMYRRFGLATRVVELYPDQTWLDDPEVEGDTRFNSELEKLEKRLGLWRQAKALDTYQRVGRYAGLFMRVRDNKKPNEPLEGVLPSADSLMGMMPIYEGQLKVLEVDNDPMSDTFSQPKMYQFDEGATGSRNELSSSSFSIHPSRLIIAAEGANSGSIYGIPVLESIYNSLMDLRKIFGGGGEGFYRNAAQSTVFDIKDAASVSQNKALLEEFNEQADDFLQNRMRRSMMTPGMEVTALQSNLINPKDFALNSLMDVTSGAKTPIMLLVGNQTGRLAGDQDNKSFLTQVNARRKGFGTEIVTSMVDWCVRYGVLPASEYEVEWPDAMAPSDTEKLTDASSMATINKTQYESGGEIPFSGEEIREQAGYKPNKTLELPPDESLGDDNLQP